MASLRAHTFVVLPLHNEAAQSEQICDALKKACRKFPGTFFMVVDDGSTDGTAAAGGKGRVVRLAFARAKHDFLIFMDGDLAYSFDHLKPMIAALKKADVVIGSRSMAPQPQGGLPARRAFLGWAFNRLACLVFGFDYPDTQAGLKGFTQAAARQIFSRQKLNDFAFDAELLYLAKKRNLKVVQIPAEVSGTHTYKTSQVKLLKDSLRCLMDFCLVRWWSWTGAYNLP
ncbi:MAG: glycosyltransferase [Verrucomicrobia bacterium]|nr:glycosyltransferase [Verrucomicrobiota bacterium]